MCNYCQTNLVTPYACGCNTRWRVQRVCYDCQGNIHIIVTNGCVSRQLIYGDGQENTRISEVNTFEGCGNGCRGGCTENVTARCGGWVNGTTARCGAVTQDGDLYYARLYGLNSNTNGRSCGCMAL